jgi:hypothetical protein
VKVWPWFIWLRVRSSGGYTVVNCYSDQIKEDKDVGTCGTHGRDDKRLQYYWLGNLKGRDHLEELGVDEKKCEVIDWMHLAYERDQWRALVNVVMNFWIP